MLEPRRPVFVAAQRFRIPNHNQSTLGAGQRYVKPPGVREEADIAFAVGAHAGEQDDLLLAPLLSVDGADLHPVVPLWDTVSNRPDLTRVRCDYANILLPQLTCVQ